MATFEDVERLTATLPEGEFVHPSPDAIGDKNRRVAQVLGKGFFWERPLNKSDVKTLTALGREIPTGVIVAFRTADIDTKRALLEMHPDVFFEIPHFEGFKGILAWLENMPEWLLVETLTEAWMSQAPPKLVREFEARG